MSDIMLFGVLRMPQEMALSNAMGRMAYWERAQQACDRIEALERDLAAAQERVAELLKERDEVERLERDAARYRWLADKVLACDYGDNSREDFAVGWIIRHCKGPSVIYGPSIDAAIDAAISAGAKQQEAK